MATLILNTLWANLTDVGDFFFLYFADKGNWNYHPAYVTLCCTYCFLVLNDMMHNTRKGPLCHWGERREDLDQPTIQSDQGHNLLLSHGIEQNCRMRLLICVFGVCIWNKVFFLQCAHFGMYSHAKARYTKYTVENSCSFRIYPKIFRHLITPWNIFVRKKSILLYVYRKTAWVANCIYHVCDLGQHCLGLDNC